VSGNPGYVFERRAYGPEVAKKAQPRIHAHTPTRFPLYRFLRLKASWAAMLVTVTRATRTNEAVQAI
jgi:hypothetical protein